MQGLADWIALSSGADEAKDILGIDSTITQIPSALLTLLGELGGLAGNLASLLGLLK